MINLIKISTIAALMALLVFIAWSNYQASREYVAVAEALSEKSRFLEKAVRSLKCLIGACDEERRQINQLIDQHNELAEQQRWLGVAFVVTAILFIAFTIWAFGLEVGPVISALTTVSLIALITGLFSPVVQIVIYRDMPLIGSVVFEYQSKSIVSSITTLYEIGSVVVATAIILFSIINPIAKSISMGIIGVMGYGVISRRILLFIKAIGPWSMADVFITGLLLAFFAIGQDGLTHSEIQSGLYFFMGYVILSIVSSILLARGARFS